MNWPSIILWGFVATSLLTMFMRGGQALGFTRMDLPFILGTMFTANRDYAKVYGFLVHMLNGWVFSFLYAFFFEQVNQASWWLGGVTGLIHGLFVSMVVMPMIPGLHPRMATDFDPPTAVRSLEPPGFMGLNYGRRTPIATLIAHVLYGVILGAFYALS
jgi:hypothetical protein